MYQVFISTCIVWQSPVGSWAGLTQAAPPSCWLRSTWSTCQHWWWSLLCTSNFDLHWLASHNFTSVTWSCWGLTGARGPSCLLQCMCHGNQTLPLVNAVHTNPFYVHSRWHGIPTWPFLRWFRFLWHVLQVPVLCQRGFVTLLKTTHFIVIQGRATHVVFSVSPTLEIN